MATASATVTGNTGAEQAVTALAIPGILRVNVDVEREVVQFFSKDAQGVPHTLELEYDGITTFTWTITGSDAVIVLS